MENYWNTKNVNLGKVKVGTKLAINFQANENMPKIARIKPSCGCTSVGYDEKTRLLTVKYRANGIPQHLKTVGEYVTSKRVSVEYEDGTNDILSFTVKVTEK